MINKLTIDYSHKNSSGDETANVNLLFTKPNGNISIHPHKPTSRTT